MSILNGLFPLLRIALESYLKMSEPLYWIYKDGNQNGPFTFPQVQSMWRAGTIKVTDQIRRDGKNEWHPVSKVCRHLERRRSLTVGDIIGSIVIAFIILWFLWWLIHQ
jgi:hypothetical protein